MGLLSILVITGLLLGIVLIALLLAMAASLSTPIPKRRVRQNIDKIKKQIDEAEYK